MESIYEPCKFKASEHIEFKDYFKKYSSELFDCQKSKNISDNIDTAIFDFFGDPTLDEEKQNMLISSCSVDLLTVPDEKKPLDLKVVKTSNEVGLKNFYSEYKVTDESLKLHTVKALHTRQRKGDILLNKMFQESGIDMHITPTTSCTLKLNMTPGNDTIIYIRLFRPFPYNYRNCTPKTILRFDHEIALLGSNTLAEFRDKIQCSSDLAVSTEVSECPERLIKLESAKELYPSGFIFIDGVFYNDFRNARAIDYSEVIIKWAKDKMIGDFTTADMNKVRIDSLTPRMNYPYVYQHQGNCEHLFMFAHARLTNNEDVLDDSVYPFHSNIGFTKTIFCSMCAVTAATWFITESDRIPIETLLCNDCFTSYNYVDGKKIGAFKSYPYMNRTALF